MGESDVETMGNVTVAKYDFDDEAFNDISEEALSFITQLLVKEPEKRMTASECLEHPWLSRRPLSKRPPLTTNPMTIPAVQLISDLSPPVTPPLLDNDQDSSTLSDNSESDYAVAALQTAPEVEDEDLSALPPPPPLPKTAPPSIELLIESSLPIIIPTSTKPTATTMADQQQAKPDECLSVLDEPQTTTTMTKASPGNITEPVIKTQSHFELRGSNGRPLFSCVKCIV